jgi:hypothetical protein
MQQLDNPPPLFFDQHGALLDSGNVYVGVAGSDPETSPISAFWDSALTIPATQPLRTRGGVVVNNGAPSLVYFADGDYSLRIRDADGNLVSYFPSVNAVAAASYQPLSATLTSVAALAATPYGLSLLTAADSTALRTLAGIVASLALTGGTMTGNINRASAGPHIYHTDGTFTSGRIFATVNTASDPTSADGDIWLKHT